MFESCVAPILILIISMFYKKDEQVCLIGFTQCAERTNRTIVSVGKENIVVLRDGMLLVSSTTARTDTLPRTVQLIHRTAYLIFF